jgi:hypothetical protein
LLTFDSQERSRGTAYVKDDQEQHPRERHKSHKVVQFFTGLPSRRLVVLGDAGAGKTVLAVRLVLGLLHQRLPGQPVPVLMSIGTWNPTEHSLQGWLATQLESTYPALATRTPSGITVGHELLKTGRLIPVLDGLDEMPEASRPQALRRINRGLPPGYQLVLTARGAEYQEAVHDEGGDVVRAAAVIDLGPLNMTDIQRYLIQSTAPHRISVWHRVFARLQEQPGCALARVLVLPLMVWLVRVIYAEGSADPGELLAERFDDPAQIEQHLLTQLVPTVYAPGWLEEHGSGQVGPHYWVDDAKRYLSFLGRHLRALGMSDLAWWQLELAVPRPMMAILTGGLLGIGIGISVAVPQAIAHGVVDALRSGLAALLIAGFAGGVTAGIIDSSRQYVPTVVQFPLRRRPLRTLIHPVLEAAAVGLLTGLATALLVAFSVAIATNAAHGVKTGGTIGIAVGSAIAVARILDIWLSSPADVMRSATPEDLLRGDRRSALAKGVVAGVVIGLAFGFTGGFVIGMSAGIAAAVCRPLVGDLDQGFRKVGLTAWSRFVLARTWLALLGKLPWQTMAFLKDAHRRHVLRQVGARYQFRHERLQATFEQTE